MLRVLSHLMSRYWFVLSGKKKKKLSLELFRWSCALAGLTALEGTTGQKHMKSWNFDITLLYSCASLSDSEWNWTFTGWPNSKAVCLLYRHREVVGFATVPNLRVKKSCLAGKLDIPHLCDWGKRTLSSRRWWELVSISQNHNSKKKKAILKLLYFSK